MKPEETVRGADGASLSELALLFLRLGATAFGGPAAHLAMMENEVVRRRQWLSREEFLDLLGATNLIPGPNSTEMAIHIGHRKAGWAGLLVAGSCFILPAALIVTGFAWAYVRFGSLPQVTGILYGVKPVIIAIVIQALWGLGRTALKNKFLMAVGGAGIILGFLAINELLMLSGGAGIAGLRHWLAAAQNRRRLASFFAASPLALIAQTTTTGGTAVVGLWPLFLFFLKVGAVLYGSGYVLLAFIRADLV